MQIHIAGLEKKRFANASIMSLSDARTKAKELLARLSLGDDPFLEQSQRKKHTNI